MLESSLENLVLPISHINLGRVSILIIVPAWMSIILRLTGIFTCIIINMTIIIILITPFTRICQVCFIRSQIILVASNLLVLITGIGNRIQHINLLRDMREAPAARELHLWLTCLTTLGSDDNDTVGTTRTINSCSRGILQDFDILDIMRVDHAQRVTALLILGSTIAWSRTGIEWDTIHDVKRLRRSRERVGTTYHDTHTTTRSTVALVNLHTCHLTLHTVSQVERTTLHQVFTLQGTQGTAQVALLHRTITYDNNFIHHLGIFLHRNGYM